VLVLPNFDFKFRDTAPITRHLASSTPFDGYLHICIGGVIGAVDGGTPGFAVITTSQLYRLVLRVQTLYEIRELPPKFRSQFFHRYNTTIFKHDQFSWLGDWAMDGVVGPQLEGGVDAAHQEI